MLTEWIRRNMDNWDKELKDYLFTSAPLGEHEAAAGGDNSSEGGMTNLGIGKL